MKGSFANCLKIIGDIQQAQPKPDIMQNQFQDPKEVHGGVLSSHAKLVMFKAHFPPAEYDCIHHKY